MGKPFWIGASPVAARLSCWLDGRELAIRVSGTLEQPASKRPYLNITTTKPPTLAVLAVKTARAIVAERDRTTRLLRSINPNNVFPGTIRIHHQADISRI